MSDVTIQKRLDKLEDEVKLLKSVMRKSAVAHLRAEIVKGLESGPGTPIDANFWKRMRAHARAVAKQSSSTRAGSSPKIQKKKKITAGLRQGLKEMRQGKLSGPFGTVDELMAHLQK